MKSDTLDDTQTNIGMAANVINKWDLTIISLLRY